MRVPCGRLGAAGAVVLPPVARGVLLDACLSRRRACLCVPAWCLCVWGCVSPRPISTSPLSPLRGVHVWPIDPVVCGGPYPLDGGGRPHLEEGFPLRCFQRLSRPDVANQPCPWRDN